jgi:hypothetical protein
MNQSKIEYIHETLEILCAVEILEYYNKQYLDGDNKSRSMEKLKLLTILKHTAGELADAK